MPLRLRSLSQMAIIYSPPSLASATVDSPSLRRLIRCFPSPPRRLSLCIPWKPHSYRWSTRLRAASAGPPEPPFGNDSETFAGLQATLSRIQDRVRIILAVLFWMSLFFWGSAWDGRDSGRKNKGSRFRK